MNWMAVLEALKLGLLSFVTNPDAVVGLIAVILLYAAGEWDLRKKIAELIPQAEEQAALLGLQKREYVLDQLYALLPVAVRRFIPRALLSLLVQSVFDRAFAHLDHSAALVEKK